MQRPATRKWRDKSKTVRQKDLKPVDILEFPPREDKPMDKDFAGKTKSRCLSPDLNKNKALPHGFANL